MEVTEETRAFPEGPPRPRKSVEALKRRRKIIRIVIILAAVAVGLTLAARRLMGGKQDSEAMTLTDFARYGAITATVEGSGVTRAKNSEVILTAAAGTVQEIMVEEGDVVSAGDPLFVIDSEAARKAVSDAEEGVRSARDAVDRAKEGVRTAEEAVRSAEESVRTAQENVRTEQDGVRTEEENVERARENIQTEQEGVESALKRVESAEKDLADARKKRDDLTLKANWSGKLTDTRKFNEGDKISEGTVVATLVDDSRLRLTQWFSGGFVYEIREGQRAVITIPALMSAVEGSVEKVHENSRVNPEDGAAYFSVDVILDNAGALTAGMTASATIFTDTENAVSPDAGQLEYVRTLELQAGASGEIIRSYLEDYHSVEAGEALLIIDGKEVEENITDAEKALEDRQKEVDTARQRVSDARNSVADAQKRVENQRRRVTDAQKSVETAQKSVETAKRGVTDAERTVENNEKAVTEAQKKVTDAQKVLDECRAVSPIDGKVVGLDLTVGEEAAASKAAMTISDPSLISVSATVDERNMSYIKKGMDVTLTQFDTTAFGVVESISLSSTLTNGVATYPMTILVDNSDETLQINSNIQYSLVASQNDNCLIVPVQCVRNVSTEAGESMMVVYVAGETAPENAVEGVIDTEIIPEGFWPVQVETGIQDTYNVEIRSGLEEGVEVFTQTQMDMGMGIFF